MLQNTIKVKFILLLTLLLTAGISYSTEIVAVVNGRVISDTDVKIAITLNSNKKKITKKEYDKKFEEAVEFLIHSIIKENLVESSNINVSSNEISEQIKINLKNSSVTIDKVLDSLGIKLQEYRKEVKKQIAWNKYIQKEIIPKIEVTEYEFNEEAKKHNKKEKIRNVYVIFRAIQNIKEDIPTLNKLNELQKKLNIDFSFQEVATKISQDPSREKGGEIGWVKKGQLPQELDKIVWNLKKEGISKPIRIKNGYVIIWVKDQKNVEAPDENYIKNKIIKKKLDTAISSILLEEKNKSFIEYRN